MGQNLKRVSALDAATMMVFRPKPPDGCCNRRFIKARDGLKQRAHAADLEVRGDASDQDQDGGGSDSVSHERTEATDCGVKPSGNVRVLATSSVDACSYPTDCYHLQSHGPTKGGSSPPRDGNRPCHTRQDGRVVGPVAVETAGNLPWYGTWREQNNERTPVLAAVHFTTHKRNALAMESICRYPPPSAERRLALRQC